MPKTTGARDRAELRGKKANQPVAAAARARRSEAARRKVREASRGRTKRARRKIDAARVAPHSIRMAFRRGKSVPVTPLK